MTLSVAIAMAVGCIMGVFSTLTLIGLAFAVRENKQDKQEETDKHE